MAKGKETALVKKEPDLPATPRVEEDWEKKLREKAREVRSAAVAGIPRITHKGQALAVDGRKVADKVIRCVILGFVWVKTWYETEYDSKARGGQGSSDSPKCYAFGSQEKGLAPHPASPLKQAAACDDCPHNRFMTATRGRGKRCQDRPRLLLVLADDIAKDGEEEVNRAIAKAQHYQIEVPPMSIKNVGQYAGSLTDLTEHGALEEAVTEISTNSLDGGGHELLFRFLDKIPRAAMPAIFKRSERTFDLIAQPFPVLAPMEEPKPVKGQAAGKRR